LTPLKAKQLSEVMPLSRMKPLDAADPTVLLTNGLLDTCEQAKKGKAKPLTADP